MSSSHRGAATRPELLRRFAAASGLVLGAAVLMAMPAPARAGSSTDNAGALSIDQSLNFSLAYPRFLRFRVGSAGSGVVDRVTFTPTVANLGTATVLLG